MDAVLARAVRQRHEVDVAPVEDGTVGATGVEVIGMSGVDGGETVEAVADPPLSSNYLKAFDPGLVAIDHRSH